MIYIYNFNFKKYEKILEIFDKVSVSTQNEDKITSIALTNKRLLFLDYLNINSGLETLRITNKFNYIKSKDIYYQINNKDINLTKDNKYYIVTVNNKTIFKFTNKKLYNLLKENISN